MRVGCQWYHEDCQSKNGKERRVTITSVAIARITNRMIAEPDPSRRPGSMGRRGVVAREGAGL
jgi:hypothetical protein